MVEYMFVAAVVFLTGSGDVQAAPFPSEAACMEVLKALPANIGEYNAKKENPNKIVRYAAACLPTVRAPQGVEAKND